MKDLTPAAPVAATESDEVSGFEPLPSDRAAWRTTLEASGQKPTLRLNRALARRAAARGNEARAYTLLDRAFTRDPGALLLDWKFLPGLEETGEAHFKELFFARQKAARAAKPDTPLGRMQRLISKARLRTWIEARDIKMAGLARTVPSPEALTERETRPGTVLKAAAGHSNLGVVLISEAGALVVDKGRYLPDASLDGLRAFLLGCGLSGKPILVEEALIDIDPRFRPIPRDFKVFAQGGRAFAVRVIDRNAKGGLRGQHTVTRDWRALPRSMPGPLQRMGAKPAGFDEMIRITERLSKEVPVLLRWDFYLTVRGPVFGEMTAHPNAGNGYSPWLRRACIQAMELDRRALQG